MNAPHFIDPDRAVNGRRVETLARSLEHMSTETLVRRNVDLDVVLLHAWRAGGGERVGHVYFVQVGEDGPVKIGWAKNVPNRMIELQIGNHEALFERAKFRAPRGMERALHLTFGHCWIRGEWFRPHVELTNLIRRISFHV